MKRHDFEPAALITGLVFLGLAAAYVLDATGAWDVSPAMSVPLAGAGLALAATTAVITRAVRRRAGRNRGA